MPRKSNRGGYQKPGNKNPGPSGVGKYSKRTDGMEKPRTPDVGNSDLVYGDKKRLEGAQDIAPRASSGAPPSQNPPSSRADARGAPLDPSYLFGRPSDNPDEPITAGLDMGAGPGSEVLPPDLQTDPVELIYTYLLNKWGSEDAARLLSERRATKMGSYGRPQGALVGGDSGDVGAIPAGADTQSPLVDPASVEEAF